MPSCSVAKQSLPVLRTKTTRPLTATTSPVSSPASRSRVRRADLGERVGARHLDRVGPRAGRQQRRPLVPADPDLLGQGCGRRRRSASTGEGYRGSAPVARGSLPGGVRRQRPGDRRSGVLEQRRTSFGQLAPTYDAVRPEWPAATISWLIGDRSAGPGCSTSAPAPARAPARWSRWGCRSRRWTRARACSRPCAGRAGGHGPGRRGRVDPAGGRQRRRGHRPAGLALVRLARGQRRECARVLPPEARWASRGMCATSGCPGSPLSPTRAGRREDAVADLRGVQPPEIGDRVRAGRDRGVRRTSSSSASTGWSSWRRRGPMSPWPTTGTSGWPPSAGWARRPPSTARSGSRTGPSASATASA